MSSPTRGEAPLAHAGLARFASGPREGLLVRDIGVPALLLLRAREAQAMARVAQALGVRLPDALQSAGFDGGVVRWQSPDSWLISLTHTTLPDVEQELLVALDGHGAVVDVSGAFAVLELSGPAVPDVLRKSTSYDVHPDNFAVGKVVSTTFAQSTVSLRAMANGTCELIVRRSLAVHVFNCLSGASQEYGLKVVTG